METKQMLGRIASVCTAVALTLCGAWYASAHAARNALQAGVAPAQRQVIILDAGHGASHKT